MSQAPIKVDSETKEAIRIGAAVLGLSQAGLVGEAVREYVERHSEDFDKGLADARRALALGTEASVSFVTGDDVETIRRVSGQDSIEAAS